MRGGYSDHGSYCGAFCIDSAEPALYFYWAFGAALDIASYYPIRGGHCNDGFRCGILFVSANGSISLAYWTDDGAALSLLLHIILFMVVVLTLVMIVEYSMLLPTVVLLLSTGMLVLLYYD